MIKPRVFLLSLLAYAAGANAATNSSCPNPTIKIAGPRQVVFEYKKDHCSEGDAPDTPTMAFKDADGQVRLFNGLAGSYMSVGSSLDNVRRDCSKPFNDEIKPAANNTPQSFDNWKWFRSPWTNDGKTIYGLIHNEFHGWEQPAQYCPSKKVDPCLYPNVTASKSTDGGKTFQVMRDGNQVVLGLVAPYAYDKSSPKQAGIRAPTNIISQTSNGQTYYYLLASNRGHAGIAQKTGTCLYRSDDVSQPDHWRAWDGKDFTVVMNATPYRDQNLDPKQHLCQPVFNSAPSSWSFNTTLNKYVAVVGMNGGGFTFAYVTSDDMIHWTAPKALMKTTFKQFQASKKGAKVSGQTYPSMLDPTSAGMNFEFTGDHPYLYFARFNPKSGNWHNRDIIRVQLNVSCGK